MKRTQTAFTHRPTTAEIVRDHLQASERAARKMAGSKTKSLAFLVEAGILTKSGKRLAAPYR